MDYIRLLAAFAIVWFHSNAPGHQLAYLGLPFFLVLLGLPSRASLKVKARRLLRPFVVWSLIYSGAKMVQALLRHEPPLGWLEPWMLMTGTSLHLWFLPFAFVVSLLYLRDHPKWLLGLMPVVGALAMIVFAKVLSPPFAQWAFGIVPLTLGYCYFRCGRWVVLPWVISVALLFAFRPASDNGAIALGTAASLLLMQIRLPQSALSDWCARLSLLIYLDHLLVIGVGQFIGLTSYALALFAISGAMVLSLGITWLARVTRFGALLT
ncbi:acyltransferase family protein [Thioclava sp.]|uniref:acyltransferase family protein n=1 Tax=Thioclava sp. TaxID=1933450 RepID=UPI003AA7B6CD